MPKLSLGQLGSRARLEETLGCSFSYEHVLGDKIGELPYKGLDWVVR